MATIILHQLYKLCCEKRFRANEVIEAPQVSRKTLYKYLIMPKDEELPEVVTDQLNETTDASSTVQQRRQSIPRSRLETTTLVQEDDEL